MPRVRQRTIRGGQGVRSNFWRATLALGAIGYLALALPADAYDPVLHEFVPPDPAEDVALSVTTVEGDLPAAIETSSGVVQAPDTQRRPTATERAYGGAATPAGADATYRPDRNTRRPDTVTYEDGFSPSISPYKRLRAFDAVGADYVLRVRDNTLNRVPIGGSVADGEDSFYGDFTVDFEPEGMVRIPSVGPGARILRLHTTPEMPIEVVRDGADNWYAKSSRRGRARLVMQVSIARAAFGFDFGLPAWSELRGAAPLPPMAVRAVARVAEVIGVSRAQSPREVLGRMVSYFRAFTPSDEPPTGHDDVYLDLSLSQKGVCRHRAFAFLVTALGLGIPARMVTNEAHAWVEVSDGRRWHRIDLGGAAGDIQEPPADSRPAYGAPPDPFEWPRSDESSGQATAERGRRSRPSTGEGDGDGNGSRANAANGSRERPTTAGDAGLGGASRSREAKAATAGETPATSGGDRSPEHDPSQVDSSHDEGRPAARVIIEGGDSEIHRGSPLQIAGNVEAAGAACGYLRVDVALRGRGSGDPIPVGSLATDEKGRYHGAVVLPLDVPVGDYELVVTTPGDARCGPGAGGSP